VRHPLRSRNGSADPTLPPRAQLGVLERFGRRCDPSGGCGRPLRPGDAWTCDHIQAVRRAINQPGATGPLTPSRSGIASTLTRLASEFAASR
jgi:hypothetical protein